MYNNFIGKQNMVIKNLIGAYRNSINNSDSKQYKVKPNKLNTSNIRKLLLKNLDNRKIQKSRERFETRTRNSNFLNQLKILIEDYNKTSIFDQIERRDQISNLIYRKLK